MRQRPTRGPNDEAPTNPTEVREAEAATANPRGRRMARRPHPPLRGTGHRPRRGPSAGPALGIGGSRPRRRTSVLQDHPGRGRRPPRRNGRRRGEGHTALAPRRGGQPRGTERRHLGDRRRPAAHRARRRRPALPRSPGPRRPRLHAPGHDADRLPHGDDRPVRLAAFAGRLPEQDRRGRLQRRRDSRLRHRCGSVPGGRGRHLFERARSPLARPRRFRPDRARGRQVHPRRPDRAGGGRRFGGDDLPG